MISVLKCLNVTLKVAEGEGGEGFQMLPIIYDKQKILIKICAVI